jgi:glycosyltransferase involved in cell wall biosynthesis
VSAEMVGAAKPASEARVALVAYACEPGRGSEPGAGWSWALELARLGPTYVITRANNREAIESWTGWSTWAGQRPEFVYYDLSPAARRLKRVTGAVHLYHYAWQMGAASVVRGLAAAGTIDVAHHVTFGAYWYPSAVRAATVPYIVGPVGGAEYTPKPLRRYLSATGRLSETLRMASRYLAALDPFVRSTLRGADIVYATTEQTQEAVRKIGASHVEIMAHVGWRDESGFMPRRQVPADQPLTLLSASRLIDWKGIEIGMRAFADMADKEARYVILGQGPASERLAQLAETLGVGSRVRFISRLGSHDEVLQLMADCDVFVHPAMHESGGMSVAEAMGVGLPCVVLAIGGPGLLVDATTGFAIAPDDDVVRSMTAALDTLATDVALRARMGEAASNRIREHFSWPARAVQIRREYAALVRACMAEEGE